MIVTLSEVKSYLRLDEDYVEEDTLLNTFINVAEEYLKNATGITFDSTNALAKLYINVLVSDYYNNRSYTETTSTKTRFTLQSIMLQLQNCYIAEV